MSVIELEHRDGRIGTEIRVVRRAIKIRFSAADLPYKILGGGWESANQGLGKKTVSQGKRGLSFPKENRMTLNGKKRKNTLVVI